MNRVYSAVSGRAAPYAPAFRLDAMDNVASALERLTTLASSPHVDALAEAFESAGHELALVGGPVRDAFLNRPVNDLDFATNATPDQILEVVEPISSAQWDIGRAFGTIGLRIDGHTMEITTYRTDAYDGETRKPVVEFGETIEGDLVRRDFTVNSMALRLPTLTLVDPSGGVEDLLARKLSTPAAPEVSFGDDPLRMLRAARFTSQLGFRVTDEVQEAMSALAAKLEIISVERISDELSKLLKTDAPRTGIELLVETGLANQLLTEIPARWLEIDEHHHRKDVYQHSLTVLEQAIDLEMKCHLGEVSDITLRLAALLHEIGKTSTKRTVGPGVVTFLRQEVVGSKMARKRLRELRFD